SRAGPGSGSSGPRRRAARSYGRLRVHRLVQVSSLALLGLVVEVAAVEVPGILRRGPQLGLLARADLHHVRAPRMETAAARRGQKRRRRAGNLHEPLDMGVETRQPSEEPPRARA